MYECVGGEFLCVLYSYIYTSTTSSTNKNIYVDIVYAQIVSYICVYNVAIGGVSAVE